METFRQHPVRFNRIHDARTADLTSTIQARLFMAGNPTQKKRQREIARKEQAADKAARRAERKAQKEPRGPLAPGEDPDLAGIVPGPQPIPEDF
jgi:hypothetical protein